MATKWERMLKLVIQIFCLAQVTLFVPCSSMCDTLDRANKIRTCLQPLLGHVIQENSVRPGNYAHKLLEVSLGHYFNVLKDEHENEVHADSLSHILMPLDGLLFSNSINATCRKYTEAQTCLAPQETWCDQEQRDVLTGLEDAFKFICAEEHREVFKNNSECLQATKESESSCQTSFNNTMYTFITTFIKRENSRLQYLNCTIPLPDPDDHKLNLVSTLQALSDHIKTHSTNPISQNNNANGQAHIKDLQATYNNTLARVCSIVSAALICNHEEVRRQCGSDAAEWESQLRLSLIQMLLIDMRCEELNNLLEPAKYAGQRCFSCSNSTQCLDRSKVCDGKTDCPDGGDEEDSLCDPEKGLGSLHVFYILAGVAGGAILLLIIICFIIKCKEAGSEGSMSLDDGASVDIMKEEESVGSSTPPQPGPNELPLRYVKYSALEERA